MLARHKSIWLFDWIVLSNTHSICFRKLGNKPKDLFKHLAKVGVTISVWKSKLHKFIKDIKPMKSISILYESIFWSNSSCVMSHSMSQMLSHLFFAISSYHQTSYLICFRICCYAGFPPHLISSRRIYWHFPDPPIYMSITDRWHAVSRCPDIILTAVPFTKSL